jgi:hypothetical protein
MQSPHLEELYLSRLNLTGSIPDVIPPGSNLRLWYSLNTVEDTMQQYDGGAFSGKPCGVMIPFTFTVSFFTGLNVTLWSRKVQAVPAISSLPGLSPSGGRITSPSSRLISALAAVQQKLVSTQACTQGSVVMAGHILMTASMGSFLSVSYNPIC